MTARRTRPAICTMRGCGMPANKTGTARGYCTAHYWRIIRTGFAECAARDCHDAIGKYGEFGFCAHHAREIVG